MAEIRRYLFFRCNDGHLFQGTICPFDGWSMEGFEHARLASIRIEQRGAELSISTLLEEDVAEDVLKRIAVIEFGADDAVFEAVEPAGYWIDGRWLPLRSVGSELK